MDNNGFHINLYIETTRTGPSKGKTAGAWLAEYKLKSGQPVTRGKILYSNYTTENEMVLELIQRAFSILNKTCRVRVFTKCPHVLNTMNNHWLWQWQKNHWLSAKNRPVNNAYAWKACAELLEKHMTEWTDECHSYRMCMQARMHKELMVKQEIPEKELFLEVDVPEWNTR